MNKDELERLVEELYLYRDLYVERESGTQAPQKSIDVERKMVEVMEILDANQHSIENKAEYYMLKGKCFNVASHYDQRAEESLSKAVKLDPSLVEAWNNLGECFWKKSDISAAKDCFTGALQHKINKVSLRNLSMVLRQFGKTEEEKLEHVSSSVIKAREAVQLDVSDGTSWFVLGNAYLAQFFGGTQSDAVISACMKAYAQAEKDPVAKNNPDLHYNRSMCSLYQSEFQAAAQGFKQAARLDPSSDLPSKKLESLKYYLTSLSTMVETKCSMDGKTRLQKIISSINDSQLGSFGGGMYNGPSGKSVPLSKISFTDLQEGANKEKVVCGKVLGSLSVEPAIPYTFIYVDKDSNAIAVCLYNVSHTYGLKTGDSVAIAEPHLMSTEVQVSEDKETIKFRLLRVQTPMLMVVNGKKLGIEKQAPAKLSITAQSE